MKLLDDIFVVFILFFSSAFAQPQRTPIEKLPFVHITTPNHFQCLQGNSLDDFNVNVIFDGIIDPSSFICVLVDGGHFNEKKCHQVGSNSIYQPSNLKPGCHVIIVWWESSSHFDIGSAHSVLIQIPDNHGQCQNSCTHPSITSPNIVTGGCFHSSSSSSSSSSSLENHNGSSTSFCCPNGCCEFVNIASRCSQFSEGLPSCAACMRSTTSSNYNLLSQSYKTTQSQFLSKRYLELMKNIILDIIFHPSPIEKIDGHIWPNSDTSDSLSMVGRRRLDHIHSLIDDVILRNIPGDFVECGCWRGGVAALVTAIFKTSNELKTSNNDDDDDHNRKGNRIVWLFDSFQGLPKIDIELYPDDDAHRFEVDAANEAVLQENSIDSVIGSFKRLELFDEIGTRFVPGFFKNSIPELLSRDDDQLKHLSVLRLDGDLYQSTIEALHYLYPYLSIGGHLVVDDFTDWVGCRRATLDFRLVHNIEDPIQIVWHDVLKGEQVRGIWWTKTKQVNTHDVAVLMMTNNKNDGKYSSTPRPLQPSDYPILAEELKNK